jgi:signal transduction histidine kinase
VQKRLTTQRLFALMLGALAALMVIAAIAGGYALAATSTVSNRLADRIAPASTAVVELRGALVDQETAVRGYLLSGEDDFLGPYQDGQATERDIAARIRALLGDQPDALRRLDVVERHAAQWRDDVAQPTIDARDRTGAAAIQLPVVAQGKQVFDGVRADVAGLERTVQAARTAARAALEDARELRNIVFAAIVVVFALGLIGIAALLRIAVLRPLQRLGRVARDVAGGNFDRELPRSGPRDLVALADDLDDMRRQIADALARSAEALARTDEALARTDEALAHSDEAARQLEQQTIELRRSNSDLEQFAYVASHDLQEPLRKVASFCQMLQRRYDHMLDDRGRQYIHFAVDGATRMQTLINDLLAFSRVGRVFDSVEDVALDDVFDRAEAVMSGRIEDTGATVERPALPVVRGDATLLTMLWQNLLSNALKFAHPDRLPRITVDVSEQEEGPDGVWQFGLADNGIGVEPQYEEKIFVIFQRLHPRGSYPGTGIGLAICKRIIEFHGGRIWLDTEVEEGTRIRFTLPRPD